MKVIILDDDPQIGNLIADIIRRVTPLAVTVTTMADIAITLFDAGDLVIFDLNLTDYTSCAFVERLRKIDSQVKTIVCTGAMSDPRLLMLKNIGVNDFIIKPCSIDVIAKKVNKLCFGKESYEN